MKKAKSYKNEPQKLKCVPLFGRLLYPKTRFTQLYTLPALLLI